VWPVYKEAGVEAGRAVEPGSGPGDRRPPGLIVVSSKPYRDTERLDRA